MNCQKEYVMKMITSLFLGLVLAFSVGTAYGSVDKKQTETMERQAAMKAAWSVVLFKDDITQAAKLFNCKDMTSLKKFILIFGMQEMAKAKTSKNADANADMEMVKVPKAYAKTIKKASEMYKVPVSLIVRVAKVESGFNKNATSPKGAMGVMQLMPGTASDLGLTKEDAYNPYKNIPAGVRYLKLMLEKYNGDEDMALYAYNHGPGATDRRIARDRRFNPSDSNYVGLVKPKNRTPRNSDVALLQK